VDEGRHLEVTDFDCFSQVGQVGGYKDILLGGIGEPSAGRLDPKGVAILPGYIAAGALHQ
jgi:hypothetical protein